MWKSKLNLLFLKVNTWCIRKSFLGLKKIRQYTSDSSSDLCSFCTKSALGFPLIQKVSSQFKFLYKPQFQKYLETLQDVRQGKESDSVTVHTVGSIFHKIKKCEDDLVELDDIMNKSTDEELKKLAEEDFSASLQKLKHFETEIIEQLCPPASLDSIKTVMEMDAGVGGQEAMLFCQELFNLYRQFAQNMGWNYEVTSYAQTDLGGIRHGILLLTGANVFKILKFEGGIHRVQRVPKTERSGRIHTSTVSVAVIPHPEEVNINIAEDDLKIETMRASGAGGQHVNKTDSAVRITYLPTGLSVESQESRSQFRNKQTAMIKLKRRLFQIETDKMLQEYSQNKKLQVGTKARSDKIRTYNFPQDRVTDHRIGISVFNIENVLSGGDNFHHIISALQEEALAENVWHVIENKL